MQINSIIFPGKCYKKDTLGWFQQKVILIPNETGHIPCIFFENPEPSNKLMIFFHGNAEDIGSQSCLML